MERPYNFSLGTTGFQQETVNISCHQGRRERGREHFLCLMMEKGKGVAGMMTKTLSFAINAVFHTLGVIHFFLCQLLALLNSLHNHKFSEIFVP